MIMFSVGRNQPICSLRSIITAAAEAVRRPLADFTVLSASRDPYRQDTPAGHTKGQWLADAYHKVNPEGRRLHLRGLHYRLVGRVQLPDGRLYVNDDETWTWMSEQAAKAARFLGYLPWDALRDARNAPPKVFKPTYSLPQWNLAIAEVYLSLPDDLEPRLVLSGDLYRQPWQQIIVAEKQGVSDILEPIAKRYQASLMLPGGELSDQALHDLLRDAAEDGRPVAIHQLGDFDPSGHQMAVSTARTAQALRDAFFPDLTIHVHAPAMTRDQCRAWNLPSTPLKETEHRADRWQEAMGWEQTELDAAVALAPQQLAAAVRASLDQYHDPEVSRLNRGKKEELEESANDRLSDLIGGDLLDTIRAEMEQKLQTLTDLTEEVNQALQIDIESLDLELEVPPVLFGDDHVNRAPLFDSQDEWATASQKLLDRKRYGTPNQVV